MQTVRGSIAVAVGALVLAACGGRDDDGPRAAGRDAGAPDAAAPRERIVATANVRLDPTAAARSKDALTGTATFRTTSSGVDLEGYVSGCKAGGPFAVTILDAGDCEPDSLQAQPWPRGDEIASINCVGATGPGRLYYAHGNEHEGWTIGGPAKSNVLGRALVVRDPSSDALIACGVIERGEDVTKVPLPPEDQAPGLLVRAQLAGVCIARQISPNAGAECADSASLVACADDHCELGACLETCAEHAACLDQADDPCTGAFTCPITDACSRCQGDLWLCASGYCPELFSCLPPIKRDGPCAQLEACCALQGEDAPACLQTVRLSATLGGDPTCEGAMQDWDVLSHLHVPCKFEE